MAKVADEVGSTANSYQILGKLAVGGMAEIFLARGASVAGVERYCVLKRILREHARDAQFARMFLDEARLAAQLQHPNIASVYDIGMLGESYFFTMEYVHGETVRSLLQRAHAQRRQVPLACALTIAAGTAAGLHHAHERHANDGRPLGIVHRDVSPSNLMVSFEGSVKVVDFGVAKAANRAVETKSGTVKGKISYLSPEQCRGERVDRRSDLFSLGIVLWELLTGSRLYRRDSDFESMTAIVHEPPPPPSKHRPEVPRAVDDIVLRLLAKSVADRFQTADEVVEAIENASMRAGTILSTSALSRLVRDLFGMRAVPWLEFEGDTRSHQAMSFLSRPVQDQLGDAPIDDVERGLAGVLDLSAPSVHIEAPDSAPHSLTRDPASSGQVTAPTNARPSEAIPVAAPASPSAPVAAAPAGSAPVRVSQAVPTVGRSADASVAHPAPPATADRVSQAMAAAGMERAPPASIAAAAPTARPSQAGVAAAPSSLAAGPDSLSFAPSAVAPNAPNMAAVLARSALSPPPIANPLNVTIPGVVPPSAPHRVATASASIPVADLAALPSTPPLPPSALHVSLPHALSEQPPAMPRHRRPRTSRSAWPLIGVIVVAAAIGVVAAWLVTSTTDDDARQAHTHPAVAHTIEPSGATPAPTPSPAAADSARTASGSAATTAAPTAPETPAPPSTQPDVDPDISLDEPAPPRRSPGASHPASPAPPTSPKATSTSPPASAASPTAPSTSPKATSTSPPATAASPTAPPTSPKATSTSPPATAASPTAPATSKTTGTVAPAAAPPAAGPQPSTTRLGAAAQASPPAATRSTAQAMSPKQLRILYDAGYCLEVMRECSAAVTLDTAGVCTFAACELREAAKAREWAAANPDLRKKLLERCPELARKNLETRRCKVRPALPDL